MAVHRRPVEKAPDRLEEFVIEDWRLLRDPTWASGFRRWREARAEWAAEHPSTPRFDRMDRRMDELATWLVLLEAFPPDVMGSISSGPDGFLGVYDPVTGAARGRLPGEEHVLAGGVGLRHCDWDLGVSPARPVEDAG